MLCSRCVASNVRGARAHARAATSEAVTSVRCVQAADDVERGERLASVSSRVLSRMEQQTANRGRQLRASHSTVRAEIRRSRGAQPGQGRCDRVTDNIQCPRNGECILHRMVRLAFQLGTLRFIQRIAISVREQTIDGAGTVNQMERDRRRTTGSGTQLCVCHAICGQLLDIVQRIEESVRSWLQFRGHPSHRSTQPRFYAHGSRS